MSRPIPLARTLGLVQITLYGVGTIVGAGIYVLIGEVAAASGAYTVAAFVLAATIVSLSGYCYAQLARRFPVCAGAAAYVLEAFGSRLLAGATGVIVLFIGVVSAATLASGFTDYSSLFVATSKAVTIALLVTALTLIAAGSVRLSVTVAAMATGVELAGLLLVIVAGADHIPDLLREPRRYLLPDSFDAWRGVVAGAFIAFFAFIGFEDMVNMAEEVKNPQKNLPRGILLALAITTFLYAMVALAALAALPLTELVNAKASLVLIVERNTAVPPWLMGAISLAAIGNGCLLLIVMGARVLYGMGRYGLAPAALATTSGKTRTPVLATALVGGLVLTFALLFPLLTLAKITSTAVLAVATLVNSALLRLNWRDSSCKPSTLLIPLAGASVSSAFAIIQWWP
ncbi:MAG: APC family permease [Porticoccaceae bacterium]